MLLRCACGLLLLLPHLVQAAEPLDLFDNERTAYQHCRNDIVVWLDVPHQTYFFRGQHGYAGSKNGGYTCWADAKRSHNRPAAGSPLKPGRG